MFEVVVWGEPRIRHSVAAIHDLFDRHAGTRSRASRRRGVGPHRSRTQRHPARNVARSLDVVADVKGRDATAVAADVQRRIRETRFPLEYRAELVGDFAKQAQGRQRVLWVTVAAAVGILVVLQAAFGSWLMAFGILLTLPIALAGGVLAGAATGATLSLGAIAGILTVLGIAVRHAILLIHRCRDLRGAEWTSVPTWFFRGFATAGAPS